MPNSKTLIAATELTQTILYPQEDDTYREKFLTYEKNDRGEPVLSNTELGKLYRKAEPGEKVSGVRALGPDDFHSVDLVEVPLVA